MPRKAPPSCRDCNRSRDEVGHISRRGLCENCAAVRVVTAVEAMHAKTGDVYERQQQRWHDAMADVLARRP